MVKYQRGCGNPVKVEQFAFILMLLLLYVPMVVTLLLLVVYGGIKLISCIVHILKNEPIRRYDVIVPFQKN